VVAHDLTGELLEDVEAFVRRFVMFTSDHQAVAVALWVLHVYTFDAASTTPYLRVSSAAPESGKSRLLEVLLLLLGDERAVKATSLTPSVMFRARENRPLAFLVDEIDSLSKRKDDAASELLAIVNDAYRRGATALRNVPKGKGFEIKRFPTFGPTALAGLARLAETTESRCIPIVLQRKPASFAVEDFMLPLVEPEAIVLRERIGEWTTPDVVEALRPARPDLEELRVLRDRIREVWWPLVAIADFAGAGWPARARAAALALHGSRSESDTSDQILLLTHIRSAFQEDGTDRLPTATLLRRLVANEEGPWGRWWGTEVEREAAPRSAATDLARKLKPFGVRPQKIRLGDDSVRGYLREDFEATWSTYLPLSGTPGTHGTPLASDVPSVPSVPSNRGGEAAALLFDQAPSSNGNACLECGGLHGHRPSCSRLARHDA
jgi:hypothetical protein